MQPMNYSINVPDPSQAFLAGVQERVALDQLQQQRMAAQQQQLAQQQIQQVLNNPAATNEDRARIVAMLPPQVSAQLNSVWERAGKEQQQAMLSFDSQVFSALENNRPELAVQLYEDRATALENSGRTQEAASLRKQAEMAQQAPTLARNLVAMRIDASPGGKDFWEGYAKRGAEGRAQAMAPASLRKAEADATGAEAEATTKGVAAKYAESQAVADLEKKGWDIKAIRADIDFKRESNRIAAMNAAYNREGNELKRQELAQKLSDATRARDDKVRERVAEAETVIDGLKSTQTLIDELRADPLALKMATGPNALLGSLPGTDARTAAGKLEQLSNVFAAMNLDKLKGPTSDRDIAFLKNLGANLDKWQSTGRVLDELQKVEAATKRLEEVARKKYGAPTGQAATPAAGPAASGTVNWGDLK